MAKRYYNLEKETKAYLKACSDSGISPFTDVETVNDFCLKQKNINWSMTPTQLIEYSFLPKIWLDSTISYSYPSISTTWINLINRTFNGSLPASFQYRNDYKGSLFFNNINGSVPWFSNNITSGFTIDAWVTFLSGTGTNNASTLQSDIYQTRGFRSGLTPAFRRYLFWNTQSVPAGTSNTFSINTPTNSITYGVPINITLTFNDTTGVASIYLNGALSVASPTNRTFIPPTAGSGLAINGGQDATTSQALWHSVKAYNRSLSSSEISTTYNLLKGRFGL